MTDERDAWPSGRACPVCGLARLKSVVDIVWQQYAYRCDNYSAEGDEAHGDDERTRSFGWRTGELDG